MCTRRKVALVALLFCLLPSLAFCGAWDWCRDSSDGASIELSETSTSETTPVSQTSQSEEQSEEPTIETVSKNSKESAEIYESTLTEMQAALEEVKQSKAKDQALAIVDELIKNKAKDDENYAILAETAKAQEEELETVKAELRKESEKVHFGLGLSLGYNYLSTLSPGIDMHMRVGSWIFSSGISYSIDCLGGLGQLNPPDPTKIQTRVGIMYEW